MGKLKLNVAMANFRGAVAVGLKAGRHGAAYAALLTCCATAYPASDPWQAANVARARFEAQPTHTRADYTRIMDEFRAIYHANPADIHAAPAIGQVAELLAEQGRELEDPRSLRAAAGQYDFLAKQYPSSPLAAPALGSEVALFGSEALADPDEARRVSAELKKSYPHSAAAILARRTPPPPSPQTPARPAITAAHPIVTEPEVSNAPPKNRSSLALPVAATATTPTARVTGIRHWSTPSYTRVAIDLGDEVEYQAVRVEHPDRIFFDLHHARLAPELTGKSFGVTDDGFLTRIRAAQFSEDVTRVVLDVHEVTDYSAFLLPNPYRLIIDIHGKQQTANPQQTASNSTADTEPHMVSSNPKSASDGSASALPPMPVTDGSSGFGLPPRKSAGEAKSYAVAPPRVVIPVKPTVAKPVPNTVVSRSGNSGTEVASVSDQPGKVEATSKPTSAPISSRSPIVTAAGASYRKQKPAHVDLGTPAAPALAAAPTADGETSLVRALGLKIGRIVIDAGHGGHDSGTLGAEGIQEKDVVLDVALRLGKLLHQRMGAEIVYTRADDTFIPLETRTAIANKAQADLFISVHANSSQDSSARGVEVYYLNFTSDPEAMRVAGRENAVSTQSVHELSDLVKKIALKDKIDESRELAGDVESSLYKGLEKGNDGFKNRGVKKAPFVVLIGANMPSILAEISFVTNPEDAAQLRLPEYRQRVAESLFQGVARYATGINGVKTPPVQRVSSQK